MKRNERFRQRLAEISGQPISEQDAAEAFHNLTGLMSLLLKINESQQIIPTRTSQNRHANH